MFLEAHLTSFCAPPPLRVNGPRAAGLEADGGLLLSGAES